MHAEFHVSVRLDTLLLTALSILLIPFRWILAVAFAVAVHELFHILALCILGIRIYKIEFVLSGVMIDTAPMNSVQELICASSGPAGSLLLVLLFRIFPELAICGLVQGVYNLIPVYPSDGGRILSCLLEMVFPVYRSSILKWFERGAVILIFLTGILLMFVFPRWYCLVISALMMIMRSCFRKISCKDHRLAVQ